MKKIIKISITLIIIIAIAYYYLKQEVKIPDTVTDTPFATTTPVVIGDNMFIAATNDPDAQILAKGDLNNDTYEDAIVAVTFCGASCSITLNVVLNTENKSTKTLDNVNFEGYKSSSATKSEVTLVKINNGIISITGNGLDCFDNCTEENWNVEKTIDYKLEGDKIIRLTL